MTDQSEKITELEQRITELTEQESELHTLCGAMRQENWALAAKVKDIEEQMERRVTNLSHQNAELSMLNSINGQRYQARIKDLEAQLEAVGAGGVQRLESEAAPAAYMYHDTKDAHSVNPMLHSALLVFPCDRRPNFANETPLYTLPRKSIAARAAAEEVQEKRLRKDQE
jgi:chromosome segregation ATPase